MSFETVARHPCTDVQQALAEAVAGRIVERGNHKRLLARGGRYAELYRTPFGSQTEPDDVVAA